MTDNPYCGRCGMLNSAGYCQLTACRYPAGIPMPVPVVFRPSTNGEQLRWKSDEELAAWFRVVADCEGCPAVENFDECRHGKDCEDKWLEWLRKEAT